MAKIKYVYKIIIMVILLLIIIIVIKKKKKKKNVYLKDKSLLYLHVLLSLVLNPYMKQPSPTAAARVNMIV